MSEPVNPDVGIIADPEPALAANPGLARWSAAQLRAHLEFSLSRRVRATIYRGAMDAQRRGECYALSHLFYALLDDRDGERALTQLGADVDELRAWMDEDRALGYPGPWNDGQFEKHLHIVLFDFYQHALYAQSHGIDAAHLLVSLVTCSGPEHPLVARLREAGVSELGLKDHAAHAVRPQSRLSQLWHRVVGARVPRLPGLSADEERPLTALGARMEVQPIPAAEVHVVIHDDPYTTKVFVSAVLQEQFDMSADLARDVTDRTHRFGWAYLGPLTPEVAAMRIRDVHELARAEGFPLRLSMHEKRPRRFWILGE